MVRVIVGGIIFWYLMTKEFNFQIKGDYSSRAAAYKLSFYNSLKETNLKRITNNVFFLRYTIDIL